MLLPNVGFLDDSPMLSTQIKARSCRRKKRRLQSMLAPVDHVYPECDQKEYEQEATSDS